MYSAKDARAKADQFNMIEREAKQRKANIFIADNANNLIKDASARGFYSVNIEIPENIDGHLVVEGFRSYGYTVEESFRRHSGVIKVSWGEV